MAKFLAPLVAAVIAFVVLFDWSEIEPPEPVIPDWTAIQIWPTGDGAVVEAQPDPTRLITTIVLDDSGSMSGQMQAAKQAVIGSLDVMRDDDRVAVIGLNSGTILPFMNVSEAREGLPDALVQVRAEGRTPLTRAVANARVLLEQEATNARSFGTYRLIVTTDGVADRGDELDKLIRDLAAMTPIQLTTIGIDIEGRHVLRRDDIASFVDIEDTSTLEAAIEAAVAENTSFEAITAFAE